MKGSLLHRATLASIFPSLLATAHARPWKPHAITVVPGAPMRAEDIRPYTPPSLPPEPPLEASEVKAVEITVPEAVIEIRPFSSPMVGNAVAGARLPVRGVVQSHGRGCSAKLWYALEPFGYVCGKEARPTSAPPSTEQVLKVPDGERLPFHYIVVLVKEGDKVPLWTTFDSLKKGEEPERQLERGDTVAIERGLKFDGESYWLSVEGKVLPQKGTMQRGPGSAWQGVFIDDKTPLPFGWVTPEHAPLFDAPPEAGAKVDVKMAPAQLPRRARVQVLDEQTVGKKRWLKVKLLAPPPPPVDDDAKKTTPPVETPDPGERWINADHVNEVRLLPHPSTVPADTARWIDVDLGEQVLVLYEADKPVFATLVSSGRAIATPMGTYPVWAKVSAITMKNQPYEDKGYFVNKVPWSTFFQWHNAIHGAYWHDQFGVVKSHGCVNVAPLDARHVFEWVTPALPAGWTGLRPLELLKSPYVVTRNSHLKKQFRQDRPIGPPDRELEGQRLEEAEKRRADAAAAPTPTPTTPDAALTVPPPVATPPAH